MSDGSDPVARISILWFTFCIPLCLRIITWYNISPVKSGEWRYESTRFPSMDNVRFVRVVVHATWFAMRLNT